MNKCENVFGKISIHTFFFVCLFCFNGCFDIMTSHSVLEFDHLGKLLKEVTFFFCNHDFYTKKTPKQNQKINGIIILTNT